MYCSYNWSLESFLGHGAISYCTVSHNSLWCCMSTVQESSKQKWDLCKFQRICKNSIVFIYSHRCLLLKQGCDFSTAVYSQHHSMFQYTMCTLQCEKHTFNGYNNITFAWWIKEILQSCDVMTLFFNWPLILLQKDWRDPQRWKQCFHFKIISHELSINWVPYLFICQIILYNKTNVGGKGVCTYLFRPSHFHTFYLLRCPSDAKRLNER